ncbi:DUF6257 family protein [Streptomyces prunicolor]|uniref:DUF6257 family protein n=1 Tax=Streptomyces prunicolor TaxID=67348 RepID=UPI0038667981|nr:DUF6257 family protein [Streptomyces prunicolor]
MAEGIKFSDFTTGEKIHMASLVLRMGKRGMAGPTVDISDLKKKAERIEKRAERRKNKQ